MFDVGLEKPPGVIKKMLSDFVVREVHGNTALAILNESDIRTREIDPKTGELQRYTQFTLTKRDLAAEDAYCIVAKELGVDRSQISDNGMKDRYGVTTQRIVVEGGYIPRCRDERIWLRYEGPAKGPLQLSGHTANYFDILVRTDVATVPTSSGWFKNFYGPQRFGDDTIEVGRFILEGDIAAAVAGMRDSIDGRRLSKLAWREGVSEVEALWHPHFDRSRNFRVLQWRSHLWNELAAKLSVDKLPLWDANSALLYSANDIWYVDPQKVDRRLKSALFPHERVTMAKAVGNTAVKHEHGFRHKFALRPGAYATVFLSSMYDITDISRQR